MLERNHSRVARLTGLELWFFIVARVLLGFGVGVLATVYAPAFAVPAAWPAVIVGLILFVVAARGLFRTAPTHRADSGR